MKNHTIEYSDIWPYMNGERFDAKFYEGFRLGYFLSKGLDPNKNKLIVIYGPKIN